MRRSRGGSRRSLLLLLVMLAIWIVATLSSFRECSSDVVLCCEFVKLANEYARRCQKDRRCPFHGAGFELHLLHEFAFRRISSQHRIRDHSIFEMRIRLKFF